MREHLYRGQRCHDRKWVYGNLIKDTNGTHYIYPSEVIVPDGHHLQFDTDEAWWVIPETVGQYTGLKDKNGAKIFEGDIMRVEHQGVYIGPVYYEEAQWFGAKDYLQRAVDDGAVVIGNIHDNPELLWAR